MIGHLRGRLIRKRPHEVLVDAAGVGYRVSIPLSSFYRLGELGDDVALHVHTHVRDDALSLFGFVTEEEHELFERLIGVAGVGPRVALGILAGIETTELVAALRAGDVARLTRIPGVGKKTAERLIVELRDKLPPPALAEAPSRAAASSTKEDLLSALVNLGYARAQAERALDRALAAEPGGRFEELLRLALRFLASA